MDAKIFQEHSFKQRIELLKANASKIEEQTYLKPLDNDAISEKQQLFSRNAIEISKHDDVLKEHREAHKLATKPLVEANKQLLTAIKNGGEEVKEEVYMIADHDSNMMGIYNSEGVLISSRPLYAAERQYSITDSVRKIS